MTQAALASRLQIESPTLVRLLDRLSAKGWIERGACPDDRRAHHVHLTTQAHSLCEEITRIVTKARTDLMQGTDKAELEKFNKLLVGLKRRAEELQSAGESSAMRAGKGVVTVATLTMKRRRRSSGRAR